MGFEPTVPCGITGFQDRLVKPLRQLSITLLLYPADGEMSRKSPPGNGGLWDRDLEQGGGIDVLEALVDGDGLVGDVAPVKSPL